MQKRVQLHTDEELLELIQANDDESAFRLIYDRYAEQLFSVAYRKTQSKDVAEDLVQITFIKLWKSRKRITLHYSAKAYLHAALKNHIITWWHKNLLQSTINIDTVSEPIMPQDDSTQQRIDYTQTKMMYEKSLESLPEKCRQVFVLSRNGFSMKEIARMHNISTKTVEVHIGKALKILRTKFNFFIVAIAVLAQLFG